MIVAVLQKIDFGGDSHQVFDFVGNVIHQAFGTFHANDCTDIIFADIDFTTLCISKAAAPFQIIVVPRELVFYLLLFYYNYNSFL
jgi:hypothetical protein